MRSPIGMHSIIKRALVVMVSLLGAACGGDTAGEPLLATSLVGSFDGVEFIPVNGFATVSDGNAIIALGDGSIACGSESDSSPPRGHNAALRLPALEVGTYSNVFVQMFSNVDRFEGVGSSSGSVTITAVSAESIVGSVTFDYTDDEEREFSLAGTFEVVHCAY